MIEGLTEELRISIRNKDYNKLLLKSKVLNKILLTMGKSNTSKDFKVELIEDIIRESGVTL